MNVEVPHFAWWSPTVWWRCTRATSALRQWWISRQVKGPACQCCEPSGCCVSSNWYASCLSCVGNCSSCFAPWTTLPYFFLSSYYLYSYLGKLPKCSYYILHFIFTNILKPQISIHLENYLIAWYICSGL